MQGLQSYLKICNHPSFFQRSCELLGFFEITFSDLLAFICTFVFWYFFYFSISCSRFFLFFLWRRIASVFNLDFAVLYRNLFGWQCLWYVTHYTTQTKMQTAPTHFMYYAFPEQLRAQQPLIAIAFLRSTKNIVTIIDLLVFYNPHTARKQEGAHWYVWKSTQ